MRVLVVGAGGVGSAFAHIAARRGTFEKVVIADYDRERAEKAASVSERFSGVKIDASNDELIAELVRAEKCDAILNAVDPRFVMPIYKAALESGVTYLDMAMSLSHPHPTDPYSLTGVTLGRLRLGMTRTRARHILPRFSTRGRRFMDFFCLSPIGIRVGYPSPKLLRTVSKRDRRRVSGRVVLALTADSYYALRGVHPGRRLASVARSLRAGRGFRVGLNTWYLNPNGSSRGVLKVRHGVIEEIGLADKSLTSTRRAALRFFKSFQNL